MSEKTITTEAELASFIHERRNWGRWGKDDQVGAVNLITPEKRLAAVSLMRKGRTVSLSRPFPKTPAPNNPNPAQHWMRAISQPNGSGGAVDYYATSYHGYSTTHIDALCHVWDKDGMWNGRTGSDEISTTGTRWGGIENWSNGIVTRGVLLDVPKYRGEPFVTVDKPVHGDELERVAAKQGVDVMPGDALVVYSGREAYDRANPLPWGTQTQPNPGLHASCLTFLRERDVSILVWDMMDAMPRNEGLPWSVHSSIFAFGIGLVDNSLLEPLAQVCAEEGRHEFMLVLAPLVVIGGTGSPLNPIAMF